MSQIESEERVFEEDKNYFEQYKANFEHLYEEKLKEIEKLKLNYEQEKSELDKKLELLEIEEKLLNDKYRNFEEEKKILTDRYNKAINTESSLNASKIRIENDLKKLDRRNIIIEKNNQMINDNMKIVQNEIYKNNFEEKRLNEEKNNLKLRQEMIDSLRMKYVGDIMNSPFDKSMNEGVENKFQTNYLNSKENDTNYFIPTNRQNKYNDYEENENYGNIEPNLYPKKTLLNNNNEQYKDSQKLSIINEEHNLKNSSNNNY